MSIVLPFKFDIQHAEKAKWNNSTSENSLKRMASRIHEEIVNDSGVPGAKDHAIPSPVAHIMDFRKKMKENDEKTVLEWRGMLAAIALKDNYGLNIELKFIELNSNLGTVILDALDETCNWPQDTNMLPVFFKDNIPFAFGLPDILLCPFKDFPGELFFGVDWYSNTDGSWSWVDPPDSIRSEEAKQRGVLTVQGKKLYYWIKALNNTVKHDSPYKKRYEDYEAAALLDVELTDEDEEKYGKNAETNLYRGELLGNKESVVNKLNLGKLLETAVPPLGALQAHEVFADNVLLYAPKEVELSDENFGVYMPFAHLTNLMDYSSLEQRVFIIPPISSILLRRLEEYDGKIRIKEISYSADDCQAVTDPKKEREQLSLTCTLSVEFLEESQTINYKYTFDYTKIVWTDAMPYMLLWPNVNLPDDKWKSYYLAVARHSRNFNQARPELSFLSDRDRFYRLEDIKITGLAKANEVKEFDVTSNYNPTNSDTPVSYKIMHSESLFEAIGLSYIKDQKEYELGYLVINHNKGKSYTPKRPENHYFDKIFHIGIDFGTTSTNVHIKEHTEGVDSDLSQPRSIYSPGKFMLELIRTDDIQDRIDRESYFFTDKNELLGKIFTAGQLFNAKLHEDNPGDFTNVAGKFIEIDREAFWEPLSGNKNLSSLGIYFRLKFPDDTINQSNSIRAARLFIQSLLQTALLECRLEGANKVTVHFSYPFESSEYTLELWQTVINKIKGDFSDDPNNVNSFSMTESAAAGEHFKRYSKSVISEPILRRGYAIIDIGGGTSDVSVWKRAKEEDDHSHIHAQHSFKYAGQQLVNRTMIQSIHNEKVLKSYLKLGKDKGLDNIVKAYSVARNIKKPIGFGWTPELIKANSILDVVLDKDCFQNDLLQGNNDMRVFVRLKYLALFYLVATYMRSVDDGDFYKNAANTFTIHLAGCGAKGLKFCINNDSLDDFNNSKFGKVITGMITSIIGLPSDYSMSIMAPLSDNKEEVVSGLVLTKASFERTRVKEDTKQDKVDLTRDDLDFDTALQNYGNMIKVFNEHVDGQLDYMATGNNILEYFEVKNQNEKIIEDFRGSFDGITNQLETSNPNQATVYDNFSMLMLNYLIDMFVANPQRYME